MDEFDLVLARIIPVLFTPQGLPQLVVLLNVLKVLLVVVQGRGEGFGDRACAALQKIMDPDTANWESMSHSPLDLLSLAARLGERCLELYHAMGERPSVALQALLNGSNVDYRGSRFYLTMTALSYMCRGGDCTRVEGMVDLLPSLPADGVSGSEEALCMLCADVMGKFSAGDLLCYSPRALALLLVFTLPDMPLKCQCSLWGEELDVLCRVITAIPDGLLSVLTSAGTVPGEVQALVAGCEAYGVMGKVAEKIIR